MSAAVMESCPQPAHSVDMEPSYSRMVNPSSFLGSLVFRTRVLLIKVIRILVSRRRAPQQMFSEKTVPGFFRLGESGTRPDSPPPDFVRVRYIHAPQFEDEGHGLAPPALRPLRLWKAPGRRPRRCSGSLWACRRNGVWSAASSGLPGSR